MNSKYKTRLELADAIISFPDKFMSEHKDFVEGFQRGIDSDEEYLRILWDYSSLIRSFAGRLTISQMNDQDSIKALFGLVQYLYFLLFTLLEKKTKDAELVSSRMDSMEEYRKESKITAKEYIGAVIDDFILSAESHVADLGFLCCAGSMFLKLLCLKENENYDDSLEKDEGSNEKIADVENPDDTIIVHYDYYPDYEINKRELLLFEQVMGYTYRELDIYLRSE